jgi:hypothetical protein
MIDVVSEKISVSPLPSKPPPQPVWNRPTLPGRLPPSRSPPSLLAARAWLHLRLSGLPRRSASLSALHP